jgi:hypothetical protein
MTKKVETNNVELQGKSTKETPPETGGNFGSSQLPAACPDFYLFLLF